MEHGMTKEVGVSSNEMEMNKLCNINELAAEKESLSHCSCRDNSKLNYSLIVHLDST